MKYSYAHYRIHAQPGFNGTVHGIEFKGGQAYVNTREMGEEAAHVALQKIGNDPRSMCCRVRPRWRSVLISERSREFPCATCRLPAPAINSALAVPVVVAMRSQR